MLFSTSSKSLKIWDIETKNQISEIPAHNGMIRVLNNFIIIL